MAKTIFLSIFTIVHAAIGCASLAVAALTVFNMCGPGHPATLLTYVSGGVGCIMMFPIALPALCLTSGMDLPYLIPVAVLFNSYLWALGAWRLAAR